MKIRITQTVVQNAKSQEKVYSLVDESLPGLLLRVYPSGSKVFYVDFTRDGRRSSHKLGKSEVLTVTQARDAAREFLARVSLGEDITSTSKLPTLKELIDVYSPWVREHRKSAEATIKMLSGIFAHFLPRVAATLTVDEIEAWRSRKMRDGAKPSTVNRQLTALLALLNWAVKREILESNPLSKLERLSERSNGKVRYLSEDERARLLSAIESRTDRMKPLVVLSLNTGARRGALFALRWSDIDFGQRMLYLRAEDAKTGKFQAVPLNAKAIDALAEWKEKADGDLVFPSPRGGGILDNVKKAWASILREARIENFRWHDMRHDFASQLVMKGVDLNTVRELLGHTDMKMTLRYAHLAPEAKARAVEVL